MRTTSSTIVAVAISTLLMLPLTSACSSGVAGRRQIDTPAPKHAPAKVLQPTTPTQFSPVTQAAWTVEHAWVGRELECREGKVLSFDCRDVSLLAYLPISTIGGGTKLNDIWGWTDSATGREFALVGRTNGTSFVEITNPLDPRYLGDLPLYKEAKPSKWRDIKVYKHHAFVVAGARNHGMQVFDLTQLRDVEAAPAVFRETVHYDRISRVHNIAINEATGFAYLVGSTGDGEICGSGLHMVDVRNPRQPTFAGCHVDRRAGRGYVHDAQCTVYRGPDAEHRGREICFNAAERAISIVDVTDKQQPKTISVAEYPNVVYAHQGWLSEDHRYFFLGDEMDETGWLLPGPDQQKLKHTRTIIFDLNDLDDPMVTKEFFGTTPATDHNLYVRGRYVYQSNYRAGLRVLDVSDPVNPKEIGYFDTDPTTDNTPGFGGSWSNYPYFRNGVVAVTNYYADSGIGLFILRHRPAMTP